MPTQTHTPSRNGRARMPLGTLDTADGRPRSPAVAGRILQRDEHLYHDGDRVDNAWLVVSGVLKSYILHPEGDEQVLGFHMPGDVVGFDALLGTTASCAMVALDTANLRPVATDRLTAHDRSAAGDGTATVVASMYHEIQRLAGLLHMERCSAAQGLAAFVLDHAAAQARRGYSEREFVLPMCRRDLGNYLGLAPETLCRVFGRFRREELIAMDGNVVTILDPNGLAAAAGRSPQPASTLDEARHQA